MSFLNLSPAEFLALAASAAAFLVALYLLDRSRRRQTVATFRFWTASALIPHWKRRRWIQQPWSLLLQIASVLLLLTAVAGLRWGSPEAAARDHVIVLDASAWMAARGRSGALLDEAKAAAVSYVRALPSSDRVMLIRADALATPVTGFLNDRGAIFEAIRKTQAGATALRLEDALQVARQAQRLEGRSAGSIVYAGAGRVSKEESTWASVPGGLRVLPVSDPPVNCGLRGLSLRRAEGDPASWEIFVTARNYGRARCDAPLTVQFGGALIGAHRFLLAPGEESSATFRYRTRTAGWIEARLRVDDALETDNHAEIEVPAQPALQVLVYSEEPELLRHVLEASPSVQAVFASPKNYDPGKKAAVVVLDRFRPSGLPQADTVWIEPPPGASPFQVRTSVKAARVERWHAENPLGAGLATRDLRLEETQVFEPAPGDLVVADCAEGPVIVARPGARRAVALGFHPGRGSTRFELATPLLFANLIAWLAPDVFRQWDFASASAGMVTATMDPAMDPGAARVVGRGGRPLPFTVEDGSLRFFAATTGSVQILGGNRAKVLSVNLPDVAGARWEPPPGTPRGLPGSPGPHRSAPSLWPLAAVLGALGLCFEWMRFGPRRRLTPEPEKGAS